MGGRVNRGQLPAKQVPAKQVPAKQVPASELPLELLKLQGRFAAWRDQRRMGQRIPGALWDDASTMAEKVGLHRTASVLKLDYYSLKKRLEQNSKNVQPKNVPSKNSQPIEMQSFVELPASPLSDSRQYTIEIEDIAGARMRICLKGYDAPDVVALSQQFWSSE